MYLDKAINKYSEHSADIRAGTDIGAPQEVIYDPLESDTHCANTVIEYQYDDLGQWFYDGITDCGYPDGDINLLITNRNTDQGIMYDDRAGAAGGGPAVDDLNSFNLHGCGDSYRAMWVIMHEVGHALMNLSEANEHDAGYTYDQGDGHKAYTCFAADDLAGSDNYCGEYVQYADEPCGDDDLAMGYSECTENHM